LQTFALPLGYRAPSRKEQKHSPATESKNYIIIPAFSSTRRRVDATPCFLYDYLGKGA